MSIILLRTEEGATRELTVTQKRDGKDTVNLIMRRANGTWVVYDEQAQRRVPILNNAALIEAGEALLRANQQSGKAKAIRSRKSTTSVLAEELLSPKGKGKIKLTSSSSSTALAEKKESTKTKKTIKKKKDFKEQDSEKESSVDSDDERLQVHPSLKQGPTRASKERAKWGAGLGLQFTPGIKSAGDRDGQSLGTSVEGGGTPRPDINEEHEDIVGNQDYGGGDGGADRKAGESTSDGGTHDAGGEQDRAHHQIVDHPDRFGERIRRQQRNHHAGAVTPIHHRPPPTSAEEDPPVGRPLLAVPWGCGDSSTGVLEATTSSALGVLRRLARAR